MAHPRPSLWFWGAPAGAIGALALFVASCRGTDPRDGVTQRGSVSTHVAAAPAPPRGALDPASGRPASEPNPTTGAVTRGVAETPTASALPGEPVAPPAQTPLSPPARHLAPGLEFGYAQPPPQVLACGPLGFVRLTEPGFEGYSYQTLTRTARQREGAFTHVTDQPGYSFLFVGAGPSLVYYQANPRFVGLGHLPALGPLQIWPDVEQRERLWVHFLKDDAVHHFELPKAASGRAALVGSVTLSGFDGRRLARLYGGQWVYSAFSEATSEPRLRWQDGARSAWLGVFPSDTEAVVGGVGMGLWLLSPRQAYAFEVTPLDQLLGRGQRALPSKPWAAASDGGRLAVLGQASRGKTRVWSAVVSDAGALYEREIVFSDANDVGAAARRGVCLAPGRPWVVVGGPRELRVLDYVSGELLLTR